MSRRGLHLIVLVLLVGGCSTAPKPEPAPVVVVYEDRPSAALAFAAPVADSDFPLEAIADRSWRQPRAFVGYETLIREYFWLRTDDRFRFNSQGHSGSQDLYTRRAVSTRVGVLER